jgi:hypothetical protein
MRNLNGPNKLPSIKVQVRVPVRQLAGSATACPSTLRVGAGAVNDTLLVGYGDR